MRKYALLIALLLVSGCAHSVQQNKDVVFLIESSPTSLDPRVGADAQSAHIQALIFDGLVERDQSFHYSPALATSWQQPDPLTVIFHLRTGVHFHDGRAFTAKDVKWTIDSMRTGAVISPKSASYASLDHIDTPDEATVVFHLKKPDNFLLTNLATGAIGIVPAGADRRFWSHPVGTGPFQFVRQEVDREVVIAAANSSWHPTPKLASVRFAIVPDPITRALEIEKGSADIESNSLPADMVTRLAARPQLATLTTRGTQIQYLGFNLRDPLLKNTAVRQAIACAINRPLIIETLLGGQAHLASSMLPETHWAWTNDVAHYDYDPARAERLLDAAGYKRGPDGVRLHLSMKSSNDEFPRLLAAVIQQQLAAIGIAIDLRSYEFASYYADVTHGAFQMYSLRWVGANESPDIFSYAFSSKRTPPKGANRGFYNNPQLDALLDDAASSPDEQHRRTDYAAAQTILARDLPVINLWYSDSVVLYNRRLKLSNASPSGDYGFLKTATYQTVDSSNRQ